MTDLKSLCEKVLKDAEMATERPWIYRNTQWLSGKKDREVLSKHKEIENHYILVGDIGDGGNRNFIVTACNAAERLAKAVMVLGEALEHYEDACSWGLTEGSDLRTMDENDLQTGDEPTPWGAKGTRIAGKTAREALTKASEISRGEG